MPIIQSDLKHPKLSELQKLTSDVCIYGEPLNPTTAIEHLSFVDIIKDYFPNRSIKIAAISDDSCSLSCALKVNDYHNVVSFDEGIKEFIKENNEQGVLFQNNYFNEYSDAFDLLAAIHCCNAIETIVSEAFCRNIPFVIFPCCHILDERGNDIRYKGKKYKAEKWKARINSFKKYLQIHKFNVDISNSNHIMTWSEAGPIIIARPKMNF